MRWLCRVPAAGVGQNRTADISLHSGHCTRHGRGRRFHPMTHPDACERQGKNYNRPMTVGLPSACYTTWARFIRTFGDLYGHCRVIAWAVRNSEGANTMVGETLQTLSVGKPVRARGLKTRRAIALFAVALVLALLVPCASTISAEESQHHARVGELWMGTPETAAFYREPFHKGLRDLGYQEGTNIALIVRYAEGKTERISALVDELIAEKVDVLLLIRAAIPIAQKRAPSIPVVCGGFNDPVAEGLVASLARPGVNITGLSWQSPDSAGKRVELANELIPNLRQAAVIFAEDDPGSPANEHALEEAAGRLGIKLRRFSFRDETSLESALAEVQKMRPQVLFVLSGPLPLTHRKRLTSFATQARIPLVSEDRAWTEAGALLAYGADGPDIFRRAASYVDKILKGAKAAELPIEQPIKFQLTINRATAKAIYLEVPKSMLLRADAVIP